MGYANIADDPFTILHTQPGGHLFLHSCSIHRDAHGFQLDQSLPDHIPKTITLRRLFTRYLDITAVPRRSFFSLLRHFATDELEKEKLDEFLSEEGAVRHSIFSKNPTIPNDILIGRTLRI